MSTRNRASLEVSKDLEIEVTCFGADVAGSIESACVKLNRVDAQRLAHTILQYCGVEAKGYRLEPKKTQFRGMYMRSLGKSAPVYLHR